MSTYVGAPILICALLGYRRKAWLALVAFSLLMMLGDSSPLWWLLHWVPPFNLLRFPVRFSIGLVLGVSVLAAYGFDRLTSDERLGRTVSHWILGFVFALCLIHRSRVWCGTIIQIQSENGCVFTISHGLNRLCLRFRQRSWLHFHQLKLWSPSSGATKSSKGSLGPCRP